MPRSSRSRSAPTAGMIALVLCACLGDDGDGGTTPATDGSGGPTAGSAGSGGGSTAEADAGSTTVVDASTGSTGTTVDTTGTEGDTTAADSTGPAGCDLGEMIDQALWDQMFLHKDDPACFGTNYTLAGLLEAAADYPTFACEGEEPTRRRELAAFLAQISHETTGGWADAPDGPYTWGLCFIEEVGCAGNACPQYCDPANVQYPCAPGRTYHGRGAIQLSWNYNYGQAGDALGEDLLAEPDRVAQEPKLAIQTALWFWMTEQRPKPSAHDVMVGHWVPTAMDEALGRVPGFGMTTNIINGGLECGMPTTPAVADRVGFFDRYTQLLSTDMGDNVYCDMMASY